MWLLRKLAWWHLILVCLLVCLHSLQWSNVWYIHPMDPIVKLFLSFSQFTHQSTSPRSALIQFFTLPPPSPPKKDTSPYLFYSMCVDISVQVFRDQRTVAHPHSINDQCFSTGLFEEHVVSFSHTAAPKLWPQVSLIPSAWQNEMSVSQYYEAEVSDLGSGHWEAR